MASASSVPPRFKVVGFSILGILDGDLVIASGWIAETIR